MAGLVMQKVEQELEEAKASPQPPIDYLWKCARLISNAFAHACSGNRHSSKMLGLVWVHQLPRLTKDSHIMSINHGT